MAYLNSLGDNGRGNFMKAVILLYERFIVGHACPLLIFGTMLNEQGGVCQQRCRVQWLFPGHVPRRTTDVNSQPWPPHRSVFHI